MTLDGPAANLLSALRKHNYTIGLITNGPSRSQWEKIVQIGAEDYFDLILVSGDLNYEKPQPEIFHLACQQLNVRPNKSCMIGDKLETDILGGKMAGLAATFWIPLNPSERATCTEEMPSFTIESLADLAPIFGIAPEEINR
jgi:N-acylneuraminate-9-phosphatase